METRLIDRGALVWLALPAFLTAHIASQHPDASIAWVLANEALVIAVAYATLAVQQLVVAIAAHLQGDRPLAVHVGAGRPVWQRWVGSLMVSVALVPVSSAMTIVTTRADGQRRRVQIARGCGVGAVIGGVLLLLATSLHEPSRALATRWAPDVVFVITGSMIAAVFLLTPPVSDSQLLEWRRFGVVQVAERHLRAGAFETAAAVTRKGLEQMPDDVLLQITLASVLSTRGDDEAVELVKKLRDQAPSLEAGHRALISNLWAWVCCTRGLEEARDEAERASAFALEIDPASPSYRDTRGHVLLWLKRYAEAEPFFRDSYARNQPFGRMSSASGMAMLCAATDRPDEALAWLAKARAEDIEHDLVARATAAVEPLGRR